MILITGGAGYIGSHVNKELSKRGHETVVVDNLVYGHREFAKWGAFELCDLADLDRMKQLFDRYPITAVMHFAAYTYVGESVEDPRKYYENNVVNTLNLFSLMVQHEIGYCIFSSSAAVYGIPEIVPIPEDHPCRPINPYGNAKLVIEHVLEDYDRAYGLKYASLRYFNAAGADPEEEIGEWHEPETHLIPLVLDAAMGRREEVEIYGTDYPTPDGTCIRDYIHVSDLAKAHVLALEHLRGGGDSGIYNLGNGNGFSVRQVIEECKKVTGVDIRAVEGAPRPGDPPTLVAGCKKAQKQLHWQPQYDSLHSIVETAWNWHKETYGKHK
jgi:UDP-glucose 4-epimerase